MRSFLVWIWFMTCLAAYGQQNAAEPDLEKFVQDFFGQPDGDVRYDKIYENLYQYFLYPLNLNTATEEELSGLYLFSSMQIKSLLIYRATMGDLLHICELQAVPGFEVTFIRKIMPFVKVEKEALSTGGHHFWQRASQNGEHFLLMKTERVLETPKAYTSKTPAYPGSPWQTGIRLRSRRSKDYSVGLSLENDAGELWKWQPSKSGFGADFTSFHLYLQNRGRLKELALGDYQLQFGQGLLYASGFYMGKGAETVLTAKKSGNGIKPYTGLMEWGFMRGVAATIKFGHTDNTLFYSNRQIDGRIETGSDSMAYLGSMYTSGYHRTIPEQESKSNLTEQQAGCHTTIIPVADLVKLGGTIACTWYNLPFPSGVTPYKQFEFSGSKNLNAGIDFAGNLNNMQLFGEWAISGNGGMGFTTGILASLHAQAEASVVYRRYDRDFYGFYGNGSGSLGAARNEEGIYLGCKLRPWNKWAIAAYIDFFTKPWLAYRADAPSNGYDYLLRIQYTPMKKIGLYLQLRENSNQLNATDAGAYIDYLSDRHKMNLHANAECRADKNLLFRTQVQWSRYEETGFATATGMALFQDIEWKYGIWKISARTGLFDTDDYNTRIYVYEKDVLYGFSMPAWYSQGTRHYLIVQVSPWRQFDFWLRIARTNWQNADNNGSGLNHIDGKHKTELTMQCMFHF